eukprot:CAMPEP_0183477814 /NCGR_PEP_ID=MMETSP0370-20130417/168850_1 /TAXON_ID=268820 /ORGANISM="Peridinium aciculiferum, Strain PAER-2" /LENGTH=156 /DNA_ID=CAMNT_0025670737 /DNA_START=30 /DNA_END=496 /DNA_ORIENTATION=+
MPIRVQKLLLIDQLSHAVVAQALEGRLGGGLALDVDAELRHSEEDDSRLSFGRALHQQQTPPRLRHHRRCVTAGGIDNGLIAIGTRDGFGKSRLVQPHQPSSRLQHALLLQHGQDKFMPKPLRPCQAHGQDCLQRRYDLLGMTCGDAAAEQEQGEP